MFGFKFPYTNFHELNLDWIIERVTTFGKRLDELAARVNAFRAEGAALPGPYVSVLDYMPSDVPPDDVGAGIRAAIAAGKTHVYVPAGTYICGLSNLPRGFHLKGAGAALTNLVVTQVEGQFLYVGGTMTECSFEDFRVIGGEGLVESVDGVVVPPNGAFNHNSFRNVVFENLKYALSFEGQEIWNEFYDCAFIGNSRRALRVACNGAALKPFNNNTFYSCRLNNNRNQCMQISAEDIDGAIGNSFIGCNIERNCDDDTGLGEAGYPNAIELYKVRGLTFTNCYFEKNATASTGKAVFRLNGNSQVDVTGCSFTLESRPLFEIAGNSIARMAGCNGRNVRPNRLDESGAGRLIIDGCDFPQAVTNVYTANYLDYTYSDSIQYGWATNPAVLVPSDKPNPVTLSSVYSFQIPSDLMATGEVFNVTENHAYWFLIRGGKLVPFN